MQQLLAGYLINAAWQAPVVALCAFLVSRFGGFSPSARNRVWLLFLGVAVVLPAVSLAALLPHVGPSVARVPAEAVAAAAIQTAAPASDDLVAANTPEIALSTWAAWAMTGLSAAIVALLILRLTLAANAARRLVRQSRAVVLPPTVAHDLETFAKAHGRVAGPVRSSGQVSSPAVVGALSPVILVPEGLAVGDDDLRAALLHEMAHVVRHDYAVNLACEVLTLPVCWHPALLALKAGVARSRELACDAMAAAALGSSKTYARRLVSLAQTLGAQTLGSPTLGSPTLGGRLNHTSAAPSAALPVGLFGRSDLEDRLMHLMKPKDIEAPALRAARLCGLAAVGAGLLGSAALLHVTPVFAQGATPAPVTAQPLAPPSRAAANATQQAQTDAVKNTDTAPAARKHHGVIINDGEVIVSGTGGQYHHTFKTSQGRELTVYTDDAKDPSPEQQREWEDQVKKAEARAAEALARVNSPEFKARIAQATARAAEAEARVNSPEFKARIAAAQARAADVEKMVNSPEFKARIARASEAAARFDTPEFKERMDRVQRRLDEISRDLSRDETPATPSSPDAPKPTP